MIDFTHCLPVILTATAIFFAPDLTPRYALFGVRVLPEFRRSQLARHAVAVFRLSVLLGLLPALSILSFAPVSTSSVFVPPFLVMAIAAAAWVRQYQQLKPFALTPKVLPVQIEISDLPDRQPSFIWLSAISFIMLFAAAVYLHANWDSIPLRFPIHWSAQGQPNGWADRTSRAIYGQLIFGVLLDTWFLVLALSIWYGVRRSNYRAPTIQILIACQLSISFTLCSIAVAPIWKISYRVPIILTSVAGLAVFAIWKAMRTNALPGSDVDTTPQSAWIGGVVYFNRQDSALAAPRRDGFGYALNLARIHAWFLLATPFAIIYVSTHWLF